MRTGQYVTSTDRKLNSKVEDALFSLPKGHFSRSPVFATTFTLPLGDKDAEGTSDKPFVLQGINEADFVSLLKVMYPVPL